MFCCALLRYRSLLHIEYNKAKILVQCIKFLLIIRIFCAFCTIFAQFVAHLRYFTQEKCSAQLFAHCISFICFTNLLCTKHHKHSVLSVYRVYQVFQIHTLNRTYLQQPYYSRFQDSIAYNILLHTPTLTP